MRVITLRRCAVTGCQALVSDVHCVRHVAALAAAPAERVFDGAVDILQSLPVTVDQALAFAEWEEQAIHGVPGAAVPRGIINAN